MMMKMMTMLKKKASSLGWIKIHYEKKGRRRHYRCDCYVKCVSVGVTEERSYVYTQCFDLWTCECLISSLTFTESSEPEMSISLVSSTTAQAHAGSENREKLETSRTPHETVGQGRSEPEIDDFLMGPLQQLGKKQACSDHQTRAMRPGQGTNLSTIICKWDIHSRDHSWDGLRHSETLHTTKRSK